MMENKLIPYQATQCISASSVVVFAPHPDDEVFGCGGAILRHVAASTSVHIVIVSDGAFGAEEDKKSKVVNEREAESLKAATILGYGEPEFWRLPDRGIAYGEALIQRIVETIQLSTADLIYAPSLLEMHPDHRALAMSAIEAVRRSPNKPQLALYEIGVPLQPNLLLDISDLAEQKKRAMECFVSQNQQQRYDLDIAALNRYRTYTLPAEVTAAEAYILVTAEELLNDPFKLYQSEHQRQRALGLALNNTDLPLVSVIIRSMDRHTLSEALDSVALQTYANIEIVVVNAKGAEHSALSDWCGNFPMRFIDSSENLGRSHAANVGLNSAKGDYLIFLDDDDTFNPEHIAGLINELHQQPNTQVAYSGVRAEDSEKNLICLFNYPYEPEKLLITNYIPIHAVLFSRELIEVNNIRFDENLDVFEDWDFWLQLSRHTTFLHVDQISAIYHAQGDSGVGLKAKKDLQQQSREVLFDKWRLLWTGKEINTITQNAIDIASISDDQNHQIQELTQAQALSNDHIHNLNQSLIARDEQITTLNQIILVMRGSTSWRLTSPIRLVGLQGVRIKIILKAIPYALSMCGGYRGLVKHVHRTYKDEGLKGIKRRVLFSASPGASPPVIDYEQPKQRDYSEWVLRYDTLTDQDRKKIKARIKQFHNSPLISVLMPVYNPPIDMLEEAIRSVQNQLYPNWELCIADDDSTNSNVHKVLKHYADNDARIKVIFRKENGHISAASNSALELVTGDYLALLDNDDLLPEQALFWISDAIVANPNAELIYSDEDKIDQTGKRYDPYFKPDWNPDLFLSHNMICHLGVYRTDLVRKLGGFREGYEGAQDYDLALRCTTQLTAQQIVHIPRVLYHWRSHSGSTAQAGSEKNYALTAGERSLNDHFKRTNVAATVKLLHFGMYRASYTLPATPPLVSLVIPTRNGLDLLKQCIDSILTKTTYKNYEILIVDNNSDCPKALAYFASIVKNKRIRVLRDERPFNYSALNNAAIKQAMGEYIALINNDIEVISPEWLTEMLSIAIQPGVGAVGARLLYPNDTLQHGGVITGIGGVAGHSHKHAPRQAYGYFARAQLIQTYSAVTAACLVIKKSIYHELNGLDEANLAIAFNDIDFCLKVREAGYRNVWTPYAELYHHESATRGFEDTPEKQLRFRNEVLYMKKRWGDTLMNDPAYNPNLTLDREDFSFAWPPRVPRS